MTTTAMRAKEPKVLHCQPLQEIINCAIVSARLTPIPLSILLVSLSGSGKSLLLNAYSNFPGIHRTDSFSAAGIYTLCRDDNQNKIRHILVSDLNIPLSRKSSTVTMLIGTLVGLMTEGMVRIDDGRIEGKTVPHNPVGLLTAMTTEEFARQARLMHRVGLIRRLIPIFFEYKTSSELDILRYYSNLGPNLKPDTTVDFSKLRPNANHFDIEWPASLKSEVIPLGQKISENLRYMPSINKRGIRKIVQGPRIVPISPQQAIQKFCESRAYLNNRERIDETDIQFAANLCDYTQYGKPVLL